MDIKNMSTEEYKTHLLKDVMAKVAAHEQGQFEQLEQQKNAWADPEHLKSLSTDEINANWDKIQDAYKK